jgi:phosphoglycerol transferase MdoB-like AlkP superfamily enzyme
MPWNFSGNAMSIKNKSLVESAPYSSEAKAYIAANIELDKAMELLIDKLDKEGILDDTVIVIVPDHYPYDMNIDTINELSDFKRDLKIGVNKSTLIIWNNKQEKVEIDKVCSQLDVLPTIYNLFGLDYDSRLIMGKDILSTEEGIAYFNDHSFVTNKATYYAATGRVDGDVSSEYIEIIKNIVDNRINMSKLIMEHDYYRKVIGD